MNKIYLAIHALVEPKPTTGMYRSARFTVQVTTRRSRQPRHHKTTSHAVLGFINFILSLILDKRDDERGEFAKIPGAPKDDEGAGR